MIRRRVRLLILVPFIGLGGTIGALAVEAQVSCYFKKCVEYSDGSRVCERTPIACPAPS
jgi:hypothetical protein